MFWKHSIAVALLLKMVCIDYCENTNEMIIDFVYYASVYIFICFCVHLAGKYFA